MTESKLEFIPVPNEEVKAENTYTTIDDAVVALVPWNIPIPAVGRVAQLNDGFDCRRISMVFQG